jgi:transposase-like protein
MQRRYKREFKVQVVGDIRTGLMGWRESAREYGMSASTIRDWLERYADKESAMKKKDPALFAEYEAKIAALERKVGQLTMENELLKKTRARSLAELSAPSSIVSGPKVVPSDGGAR